MSVSYKAVVNFKTMQVRLKEYVGHEKTRQWDYEFAYWSEHTSISREEGKTLYLACDVEENALSFIVYDSLHNNFDVTLRVRMKKFKNWNPYIHPDMQKKMDDTTGILEEATRIVKEKSETRQAVERGIPQSTSVIRNADGSVYYPNTEKEKSYKMQGISDEQAEIMAERLGVEYSGPNRILREQADRIISSLQLDLRNLKECIDEQTK
jgi:hypothetical protein